MRSLILGNRVDILTVISGGWQARRIVAFRPQVLRARLGSNEGRVNSEVRPGRQFLLVGMLCQITREVLSRPMFREPVTFVSERRCFTRGLFEVDVQQPMEQNVVAQHFAEPAVGTHRIRGDKRLDYWQSLRWDGRPSHPAAHRVKSQQRPLQDGVRVRLDSLARLISLMAPILPRQY